MGLSAPLETFQVEWELAQLVELYRRADPKRVLEIGTWEGGTLYVWLSAAAPDVVVGVDLEHRNPGLYEMWLKPGRDLIAITGSSHDPEVIEKVREFGPYDWVFIDGDHTYSAVKADWENYGPMAADGGVVVFHDILPRPSYGVSEVWAEVKATKGARWIEICQNDVVPGNEDHCGVGIAWL